MLVLNFNLFQERFFEILDFSYGLLTGVLKLLVSVPVLKYEKTLKKHIIVRSTLRSKSKMYIGTRFLHGWLRSVTHINFHSSVIYCVGEILCVFSTNIYIYDILLSAHSFRINIVYL